MALTKVPSNLDATISVTQSASDNSTNIATTAYVTTAIANLVDSSPSALNTLNELAAALGDDANFSTTVTNSIATKLPLAGGTLTGDLVLKSDGGSDVINVVHSGNTVQLVTIGQSSDNSGNGVIQLKRNNGVLHTQIHSHGSTYFNGGNVGIGFASGTPDRLLHVKGTGNIYGKFETTNTTGAGIEVKDTSEDWLIQADGGPVNGLAFYDLGRTAYRMVIDNSGNVGIGTESPGTKLDIDGALQLRASGYTTYATRIYSRLDSTHCSVIESYLNNNVAFEMMGTYADSGGSNPRIAIGANGQKVGIGTTNPQATLHLKSTAASTGPSLIFENTNNAQAMNIDYYNNSGSVQSRIRYSEGPGSFEIMPNSSANAAMILLYNGNVGIGPTNPSYPLDVSGSSNDGSPIIRGTATNTPSGGFNWATEFISPNLANDKRITHIFGKERTTHRMAHISYLPKSTASQSYLALGLWGANDILNVLGNGNVGINTVTPLTKLQVVHTAWSSGAPYDSIVHIDGGSNHDNNWGHLHVNQAGTSANIGGRIRFGTSANNGYGGNPIAGITALNKDTSNGTYGNLEFSTRPSGGTNQMRMELSHNGHIKLSGDHGIRVFTGYFNAGTVTTSFDVSGYGAGVMMMTAAFNHYGFIQSYGCYKRAICSNGPGHGGTSIEVNDVDSAITSSNGGSWTFHRQSGTQSSYRITKNAGTYAGGGYYWVRFEGNMGV